MKKKYLIVSTTFEPGGVDTYWAEIISHSQNAEWALFSNYEGPRYPLNPTLTAIPYIKGLFWKNPCKSSILLWDTVKSTQYDTIFLNGTLAVLRILPALLLIRLFLSTEIITVFHNAAIYKTHKKNSLNRFILTLCSKLNSRTIFVSQFVRSYWNQPGEVLSLPVSPQLRNNILHKKMYRIGFIGRLTHEKGPDFFCTVAEKLLSNYKSSYKTEFVVAGEGPLRNQLELRHSYVHFVGWTSDIAQFLSHIDLLVVTSRTEGFPLAPKEALEHGVPVLGFQVGGLKEVIQDTQTEWLTSVGNCDQLATKITNFLTTYEKNYATYMGRFPPQKWEPFLRRFLNQRGEC